ncbi:MAG: 4-hydroxythreonine-4-phosphate dehydrogenase PdxA [Flavobacteriaceae bacterium]|nr:4-hydroxythreonine-4-phosphate dehydrogenase PdxA [Flavobacteriaceae bacterium]
MKKSEKIKVGISIGDLNGIGVEIILKSFEDTRMLDFCTPIIFASNKVISYHKKALELHTNVHGIDTLDKIAHGKLNLMNVWREMIDIELGKATEISGKFAFESLQSATQALNNEDIDVLVTAPINKQNIQSDNFQFQGHTEYLEKNITGESLMILMTDSLKIGLITGHIPVSKVAETITTELIEKKVEIMHKTLVQDFNIAKPKIAVLGLNPHCGDHGVIGNEDDEIVSPAIQEIYKSGKLVFGPYAADSFFGTENYKKFDAVLAMYHDQGLAPFKTLSFGNGVNFTAGLDKIRTSPDHGTAYEIAGKGVANNNSFKEALFAALSIFKTRNEYKFLVKNKLKVN